MMTVVGRLHSPLRRTKRPVKFARISMSKATSHKRFRLSFLTPRLRSQKRMQTNGNYTPRGLVSRISNNKIREWCCIHNPDNHNLIFSLIKRIEGRFDADNKVCGMNARMIHEIGEFNSFSSTRNLTKLRCYPGFIGGDAFSNNAVSSTAWYAISGDDMLL